MRVQNPNELAGHARQTQHAENAPRFCDQPMTLSQASYLMMLCEETGEVLDDSLTTAEAAQRIQELERGTGRGPHAQ